MQTDAEIEHNGCSDDGMRKAKGDKQKRQGGIRDFKSMTMKMMNENAKGQMV